MGAPEKQHRILAQKIADALFLSGTGKEADRLALKQAYRAFGENKERDLGGWCREAAIDQIEKVLKENERTA